MMTVLRGALGVLEILLSLCLWLSKCSRFDTYHLVLANAWRRDRPKFTSWMIGDLFEFAVNLDLNLFILYGRTVFALS